MTEENEKEEWKVKKQINKIRNTARDQQPLCKNPSKFPRNNRRKKEKHKKTPCLNYKNQPRTRNTTEK